MATSTASLRVHLVSTPPPAHGALRQDQRSRLLKSAEALLCETPNMLLEIEPHPNSHRHSGEVREIELFDNSPLCSSSSNTLDLHDHKSTSRDCSQCLAPSPSRGASRASKKSRTKLIGGAAPHTHNRAQQKLGSGKGPQPLGKQFLLRLRSLPFGEKRGSIPQFNQGASSGPRQKNTHVMDPGPPQTPLFSPMPSLCNPSNSDCEKDRGTLLGSPRLTDHEKRNKMAKLARTFGENIPPELVFRPTVAASSNSVLISHPDTRSISLSAMGGHPRANSAAPRQRHECTKSLASIAPPPVAATPIPPMHKAFSPDDKNFPSSSTNRLVKMTKSKDHPGPQSLILGPASALASPTLRSASRADEISKARISLDSHLLKALTRKTARVSVPVGMRTDEPLTRDLDLSRAQAQLGRSECPDWGRRMERDWSGEWNVRDMDDVARRLRKLKADR